MKHFLPYYAYLRPVVPHFIGAVLCGVVYGITSGFGMPFVMEKVLPVIFGGDGARAEDFVLAWPGWIGWSSIVVPAGRVLLLTVALLPVLFAVRAAAQFFNTYLINHTGMRVLEGVRTDMFLRLQSLHMDYFCKNKTGDLTSRIMVDTNHVRTVVVDASNDLMIQPFTLVGAVIFIVHTSLQTPGMGRFLVALLIVPLAVLPVRHFGKKIAKRTQQMLEQTGNLSSVLMESLQSPREIRAYNLEERECAQFAGMVRKLFRVQMKQVKYDKMLSPLIEFISACSIAVAIYQAAQVNIPLKTAVSLIAALYFAYEPIKKLGNIHTRIKSGGVAVARIEAILHAEAEVKDPLSPVPLRQVRGEVCFEQVTFSYAESPALRDVNLHIRNGEIVALVGPSGAGKSTFANLVPRFYDPQQGIVRVDGLDVRTLRQAELRRAIALVSQEPILFNDTLYNNVLLGRADATREEVFEAAARAGAREFIEAQALGWETLAGERGGQLSGGQRQRIAIARAFLKDAPILILDEATSALDSESESIVQAALEKLARGRTTFIIAHRFSTIRFATRILVFEQGRIVADGTHENLLETCPLYRALSRHQGADGL
ncbi:MAG: ABC transporter ATP-binding protein/permease [Puniceicoccales bacterium]|jgi:subfamily B ATP-binding cassette protein MsbA|nr:ABC transporter ATP-binding protein/permease [Puniceicoccales bacterium]